jgi:hypothetical protein
MINLDHSNTYALIIGTSKFPDDSSIIDIPNVQANIQLLKECFCGISMGIPESNILISINEERKIVERRLRDIAERTKNKKSTLIVYYSGHGIFSSIKYQLYLTTIESTKKYLEIDSINIENFKDYIKESYAGRKILILDCCHSGAVIGAMNNVQSAIQSGIKAIEGTYIITSAAEDMPSLYPIDSPTLPTYFTGKLIEIIKDGMDIEQEYCSLRDIFQQIEFECQEADLPLPQQSNFNNADSIYFSTNKKFIEGRVTRKNRASNLRRSIYSELALNKFFFITFSISLLLSSLYMTYDEDYGFNSDFFYNLDCITLFLILSCTLFYICFKFLVKKLNIISAKLYSLIAYFLPSVFCYTFIDQTLPINWEFFDSDNSITWKTFVFIPIILILLYPLKRRIKEDDSFKPLLGPFIISFLVCLGYKCFIFTKTPSIVIDYISFTIGLGDSVEIIYPFLLFGLSMNFLRQRISPKKSMLLSSLFFAYPIHNIETLIIESYAPTFFSFYNLILYLIYSFIPTIFIIISFYFHSYSKQFKWIRLVTSTFNFKKKQFY